jgi:hypothetical protein
MTTLEELKKKWEENQSTPSVAYDSFALEKIFKSRVKKHTNRAMQYFWASFALQILVYALLSHVIVKYWSDTEMVLFSLGGVLLFLPFTIMLMKKFKRIATTKLSANGNTGTSLHQYVLQHHALLRSFYNFKKRYELVLIPLSSAIGIFLTFKLYVPGGVEQHPAGAVVTFVITLFSCATAIYSENKKSFEQPLSQLRQILNEFKSESE